MLFFQSMGIFAPPVQNLFFTVLKKWYLAYWKWGCEIIGALNETKIWFSLKKIKKYTIYAE